MSDIVLEIPEFSQIPGYVPFELWQGVTWGPWTADCYDGDDLIDFTDWTAKMTIRATTSGRAVIKTLSTDTGQGITLTDFGTITFGLDAEDTFLIVGDYVYDLKMTNPDGIVYYFLEGTFAVHQNRTE